MENVFVVVLSVLFVLVSFLFCLFVCLCFSKILAVKSLREPSLEYVKGDTQMYCMEDFLSFGSVCFSYRYVIVYASLWHLLSFNGSDSLQDFTLISDSTK